MAGARGGERVDLADCDKTRCVVIACFCDSGDFVNIDVLERPQVRAIFAPCTSPFGLFQVVVTKSRNGQSRT